MNHRTLVTIALAGGMAYLLWRWSKSPSAPSAAAATTPASQAQLNAYVDQTNLVNGETIPTFPLVMVAQTPSQIAAAANSNPMSVTQPGYAPAFGAEENLPWDEHDIYLKGIQGRFEYSIA